MAANTILVDFIACDLMPLAVVDSTQFKNFVHKLDPQYQLPSRKHLSTTMLKKRYEIIKSGLREKLQMVTTVNLTIDLWTNRQMKSYLGITAHFLSEEWLLEYAVLGCNRVVGRHTAENILMWYEEIVSDFNVEKKVKHVVTDSASNMKKAFIALPEFEECDEVDSE